MGRTGNDSTFNNDSMGNPQTTFWEEVTQGIGKALIWVAYITIGVIAKLAFDSKTNKLTRRQIAIKVALSVCAGALVSIGCNSWGFEKWGMVIVPTSTLIGEGLFGYIMSHWEMIADKFLSIFMKSNGKK